MTLEHLNDAKSQLPVGITLAHLNDTLDNDLQIFLLACRVNNLSRRTVNDYAEKIGKFLNFCITQEIKDVSQITTTHVRLFLLERQQHCKPVSVHDYYGTINRFFNWLIGEGILKESPMSRMHPPKVPKELIKPFTVQNIEDMLTLCDSSFLGFRNRAIILCFLDTGLRLSELANIQLTDIDFNRETIKVMGKGAKERVVRVGKETQKAILKYLLQRKDGLACLWVTEERRPMKAQGIQTMIIRLGKRAGITNTRVSPHTFRHTFGTWAIKNGANVFEVQSLLGHSTLTMTRKYAATIDSEDAIKNHATFSPVDRTLK